MPWLGVQCFALLFLIGVEFSGGCIAAFFCSNYTTAMFAGRRVAGIQNNKVVYIDNEIFVKSHF